MGGPVQAWSVLVVDDEDDLRALVSLTLEFDDDLTVVGQAADATQALELAGATKPDLVVLDHLLGGRETGLQVADRLRVVVPGARLILFSAADDVVDLREPRRRVDAVVSKMDIGELPTVIRRVMAHEG